MTAGTRYLVTGATGLVGRHLMERLLDRGGEVAVLVRPESLPGHARLVDAWRERAARSGATLELLEGDVVEPSCGLTDDTAARAARVDHVFHLAALYDIEASDELLQLTNVGGTRHVLELLRAAGFSGTLHHASSIAVAKQPGDATY